MLIEPTDLRSWILHEDKNLLVVNKPPGIVCHPSKHGPWSSLIGACREYLQVDRLHLPTRLDRETSGVVLLVKTPELASRLQGAMERRTVRKIYYAILRGALQQPVEVNQPIGMHPHSAVVTRRAVVACGQPAVTKFEPLAANEEFTLVRVLPFTGRIHQIRVHAEWLGHPVVGDKMYGVPDEVFLEFLRAGITPELLNRLALPRQALHCAQMEFTSEGLRFRAPFPEDLKHFLDRHFEAVPPLD
ncbi:MAG: RluA family pseudouridine synthase [Bryobacteraceae bacterium]|nr:RluA family pseudouridine synthase [Bryobacteraceae bacterium]MDW8379516.1 RluA family pseudouridine synthase [Bryobacterales bacterium]